MTSVENNLRSAIPTGDDVLSKCRRGLLVTTGKTEIANLERAVLVEEQVGGFQITMDDVGRVHVITSGQHLEHEVLHMVVSQVLSGVNNAVHVSLHELCDDIDIFISSGVGRLSDIQNLDDILVIKELQQSNLSDNTLGIDKIFESFRNFLDGNFLVRLVIVSTADDTVCAMTDLLNVLKFVIDTECRA